MEIMHMKCHQKEKRSWPICYADLQAIPDDPWCSLEVAYFLAWTFVPAWTFEASLLARVVYGSMDCNTLALCFHTQHWYQC